MVETYKRVEIEIGKMNEYQNEYQKETILLFARKIENIK